MWGVHTTPYTATPLAAGTSAVRVSWSLGGYTFSTSSPPTLAAAGASCVAPCIGNTVNTISPAAFVPVGVTVSSTFGGSLAAKGAQLGSPTCVQHLRVYPTYGAFTDSRGNVGPPGSASPICVAPPASTYYGYVTNYPGASGACFLNASSPDCAACAVLSNPAGYAGKSYVSPLVCHATFVGLAVRTAYNFTVSSTVTSSGGAVAYTTSPAEIAGGSFSFISTAGPSTGSSVNPDYPLNWILVRGDKLARLFVDAAARNSQVADIGQTYNSSLTEQYMGQWGASVGGVDVVINVGDFACASVANRHIIFFFVSLGSQCQTPTTTAR